MNLRLESGDKEYIVRQEGSGEGLRFVSKNGYVVVEYSGVSFTLSCRDVPRFMSILSMASEDAQHRVKKDYLKEYLTE